MPFACVNVKAPGLGEHGFQPRPRTSTAGTSYGSPPMARGRPRPGHYCAKAGYLPRPDREAKSSLSGLTVVRRCLSSTGSKAGLGPWADGDPVHRHGAPTARPCRRRFQAMQRRNNRHLWLDLPSVRHAPLHSEQLCRPLLSTGTPVNLPLFYPPHQLQNGGCGRKREVGRTNNPSICNRRPPRCRCSSTMSYSTKPISLSSLSTTLMSGAPLL